LRTERRDTKKRTIVGKCKTGKSRNTNLRMSEGKRQRTF